jgi:hypothetical protein
MRLLEEDGLLSREDATCKLFALVDDDRKEMHGSPQIDWKKRLLPPEDVLADIEAHPERHRHTFDELYNCAHVANKDEPMGVIDLLVVEAHADIVRPGCDVTEGQCACGGTHPSATQPAAG